MILFAWLLLSATAIAIVGSYIYFARQKRQCEKYPFFELRDEIIWAIVDSEHNREELLVIYKWINSAVNELNRFNFRYFAASMVDFVHRVAEGGFKWGFDPQKDWHPANDNFHPLIRKIAKQILATARANSLLIRLALTPWGANVFETITVPVGLARFIRSHPDFAKRISATREYAKAQTVLLEAA